MLNKERLRQLSGIGPITESVDGSHYIFADVDPLSGEYHEIGRGSISQLIVNLEADPQNSRLATVLKNFSAANGKNDGKGNITFKYDNYLYLLIKV